MYNKHILLFLVLFDLVPLFPLCLERFVAETKKISLLPQEKMRKTKTTECQNKLKPTENEIEMNMCSLTL